MNMEDRVAALEAKVEEILATMQSTVLDMSARSEESGKTQNIDPSTVVSSKKVKDEAEEEQDKHKDDIEKSSKEAEDALKESQEEFREWQKEEAGKAKAGQDDAAKAVEALLAGTPLLNEPITPPEPVEPI